MYSFSHCRGGQHFCSLISSAAAWISSSSADVSRARRVHTGDSGGAEHEQAADGACCTASAVISRARHMGFALRGVFLLGREGRQLWWLRR